MAHSYDYCQEPSGHHLVPVGGTLIFPGHRSLRSQFEGTSETAQNFLKKRRPKRMRRKSQCFSWSGLSEIRLGPIHAVLSVRSKLLIPLHTQAEGTLGSTSPGQECHRICGHMLKTTPGAQPALFL